MTALPTDPVPLIGKLLILVAENQPINKGSDDVDKTNCFQNLFVVYAKVQKIKS